MKNASSIFAARVRDATEKRALRGKRSTVCSTQSNVLNQCSNSS